MKKKDDDTTDTIGQADERLKTLECKLDAALELIQRGLDDFGYMDGPEAWGDYQKECAEFLSENAQDQTREK